MIKALIPFIRTLPSWPNNLLKTLHPVTSHWELGFQSMNSGADRNTQSIVKRYLHSSNQEDEMWLLCFVLSNHHNCFFSPPWFICQYDPVAFSLTNIVKTSDPLMNSLPIFNTVIYLFSLSFFTITSVGFSERSVRKHMLSFDISNVVPLAT